MGTAPVVVLVPLPRHASVASIVVGAVCTVKAVADVYRFHVFGKYGSCTLLEEDKINTPLMPIPATYGMIVLDVVETPEVQE